MIENDNSKELISVIMTNYNTPEEYLRQSIDSILNQTYSNFEFIIIDDCSTNNSVAVIESYTDKRIKLYINNENLGITKSLNIALRECKGEYIARMDADDISCPTRFERQITFLQQNPDVVVCGTWIEFIGDWERKHSHKIMQRVIPDRETYKVYLLFGNYPNIAHPTAMFDRNKLNQKQIIYDEKYIYAQDYKMWVSCSRYYECVNIDEVLFMYREHSNSISTSKQRIQIECAESIVQEQLNALHLVMTDKIKSFHMNLFSCPRREFDVEIKKWFKTIIVSNRKYQIYNRKLLKRILMKKWAEICYFGLNEKKNRKQVLHNLNIRYYPYLIHLYFQRKKNNG